jgi:hypothetical protein
VKLWMTIRVFIKLMQGYRAEDVKAWARGKWF